MDPRIRIHLLPGGSMPKRQSPEAVGYDVCIRAIVSPIELDRDNPKLRKTLFDFVNMPTDPEVASHVIPRKDGLGYRMLPGDSVLVGIGFVTEMPFPLFFWVAPRSGLASKWGITVTNAPGTVDPDYRGEAGVLVYNRNQKEFVLERGMRIAQILFQWAVMPNFEQVENYSDLLDTARGIGGFGSTGLR